MRVLIVENNRELGSLWARHLQRQGFRVALVHGQEEAVNELRHEAVNVIILNLHLQEGSAFAISDYASYRCPNARVIFVTDSSFFSDGSVFSLMPNACAHLRSQAPPEDMVAMVEYYGRSRSTEDVAEPRLEPAGVQDS